MKYKINLTLYHIGSLNVNDIKTFSLSVFTLLIYSMLALQNNALIITLIHHHVHVCFQ